MEIMGYKWIVGQRMNKMLRWDSEKIKGNFGSFIEKRETNGNRGLY